MDAADAERSGQRRPGEQARERRVAHVEAAGVGAEGRQDRPLGVGDEAAPPNPAAGRLHLGRRMQVAGDLAGPQAGRQPGEVSGHLHPCARIVAASGRVRRRCFVTDAERAVLPAFGAYAGGLNVRDAAFAGLFARPPIAGALGRQRVHTVGWRSLAGD